MKAKVAAAITDAHVEVTGAPRLLVHTFFMQQKPSLGDRVGAARDTAHSGQSAH
jgi:hypothetical protein